MSGKAKETPSLFDSIKESNQQTARTANTAQAMAPEQNMSHSIREDDKSNASRNGKSILENTAWINICASMIPDSRAKKGLLKIWNGLLEIIVKHIMIRKKVSYQGIMRNMIVQMDV